MMQKPVRYYITESDDQPVVRSVPVATRNDREIETPTPQTQETITTSHGRLSRDAITRKLKPGRSASSSA